MLEQFRKIVLSVANCLNWLPPLLARIVIGAVFVPTGWGKLHNLGQVTEFFRSLGIPAAELQAPFVSGVELACGILVLLGVFTRLSVLPLIGTMVVAIITAKASEFSSFLDLFATQEFDYIVLLVTLFVIGSGRISIDQFICKKLAGTDRS